MHYSLLSNKERNYTLRNLKKNKQQQSVKTYIKFKKPYLTKYCVQHIKF
jgi:hypothetical protein